MGNDSCIPKRSGRAWAYTSAQAGIDLLDPMPPPSITPYGNSYISGNQLLTIELSLAARFVNPQTSIIFYTVLPDFRQGESVIWVKSILCRGLYRVNQHRPQIAVELLYQQPSWLPLLQSLRNLPNQPNVIEVHRSSATSSRAVLRAKANGNSIDVGKVNAHKFRQVDYPLRP